MSAYEAYLANRARKSAMWKERAMRIYGLRPSYETTKVAKVTNLSAKTIIIVASSPVNAGCSVCSGTAKIYVTPEDNEKFFVTYRYQKKKVANVKVLFSDMKDNKRSTKDILILKNGYEGILNEKSFTQADIDSYGHYFSHVKLTFDLTSCDTQIESKVTKDCVCEVQNKKHLCRKDSGQCTDVEQQDCEEFSDIDGLKKILEPIQINKGTKKSYSKKKQKRTLISDADYLLKYQGVDSKYTNTNSKSVSKTKTVTFPSQLKQVYDVERYGTYNLYDE